MDSSQFAPSWYSAFEDPGVQAHDQRLRAFRRLWRAFMQARVFIAVVIAALQTFVVVTGEANPSWLVLVASVYLVATVAALWVWIPIERGAGVKLQWLITIGVDLVAFALLQTFQATSLNFTPLFALPVLLGAVLGPLVLGLGTAACVTIYLLLEALFKGPGWLNLDAGPLLQAGLSGTGFFLVAALANLLAKRLAREELVSASSQASARAQAAVNEVIIESLAVGVMVIDAHGVVRNANPAARAMLMGAQYPEGAKLLLSARPSWAHLAAMVTETFALGHSLETETTIDHEDRPSQHLYARTRLTETGSDRGTLCVLFVEDLREVEARVRTEKLASMGRMSAAVAHEIRNPLSAITQANALLGEEVKEPSQKRLIRMIEQNAQRLARIVDDILNIARPESSRGEGSAPAIPLDALVRQVTAEWVQQTGARQALGVHVHAPLGLVGFEPDHLRRLLVNLLDNALRHASGKPASIRVITQPSGAAHLRLSVWSDGVALEASVQQHLFEPFFSSQSRSTGLGLYICRELCERYGAEISYQRALLDQQEGNEFFVLMPALKPGTSASTSWEQQAPRMPEPAPEESPTLIDPLRSGTPPLSTR